jgi:hypothetical protein
MSNETIFGEVDEELRRDRIRALWRRFGPYVIGGAVAVVLLVAVNEGWTWWQNSNSARSSDQYYAALELAEKGDIAGAQEALNSVVAQGSGGYPTLAKFRQAALLARDGKPDAAVAAYDALATAETNARIRELALVLAAFNLVDKGDVAAVEQRVGTVAVEGSPMRNAAREAIGLTQYKAGDLDAAMVTFQQILADPLAGQDARSRVQIYVAQLLALGAKDPNAPPEGVAAPATDTATPAADAAAAPAAETSVGDAPAMDVTEPAPAASAEPVPEVPQSTAPASDVAPATDATPAAEAAPAGSAADKGASDAAAAIAAANAPAAAAPAN